jgi:hypothetical protein
VIQMLVELGALMIDWCVMMGALCLVWWVQR